VVAPVTRVAMAQGEIRLSEKERQLLLRTLQQVQLATPVGIIRSDLNELIRKFSGADKVGIVKTYSAAAD
jgi:hypothetical protein